MAPKVDNEAELALLDSLFGGEESKTAPEDQAETRGCSAPGTTAEVQNEAEVSVKEEGNKELANEPAHLPEAEPAAGSVHLEEAKEEGEEEVGHTHIDVKPEAEEEDGDTGEAEDTETYECEATQLLAAFKDEETAADDEGQPVDTEALMAQFMEEVKDADRNNEVNRILWAFKLNPFEKLDLRFTATASEVKRKYRTISLKIHPDKCKHPQAGEAFEVLGAAQRELLDESSRELLMRVLEYARNAVREERRKSTKHDSAIRLAASIHADGRQGVEREWEDTDDFHDKWKMKSRDVLARAEFRRRKLTKRLREEENRIEAQEKEKADKRKKMNDDRKEWRQFQGSRIDSWRDWSKSGKKKGGTKAPKIKTYDAERSYVQRATTEQFVGNYRKKPPK